MAMDFFQHQERARQKTGILVVYYCLAVVLIILAVYVAAAVVFHWGSRQIEGENPAVRFWIPGLFVAVTVVMGTLVGGGTLYKIHALSGGGASVAEMLGGRAINSNTTDPGERRVLNVIEEMAIASGTPIPRVFLLDEERSINAFAAGFTPNDAIIAVTRGTVDLLDRDELQGVVAHEFSHILNGDMRLNLRLIGVLNGILVLGMAGYWMFRVAARSGGSGRKKGGGAAPFIILGLAVWAIGYIGVFFGKLIKSAISRQREFLADASAVQFTRNPDGIAGALKKIGGYVMGSRLETPRAEEASHLFFANGLTSLFGNLMATHPPLGERIRCIDPAFDGAYPKVTKGPEASAEAKPRARAGAAAMADYTMRSGELVSRVGTPQAEHLSYASDLIASLPSGLREAMREPSRARAVVYCLLLNKETEPRLKQLEYLEKNADAFVNEEIRRMLPVIERVTGTSRLALIDMALPALRHLSDAQYRDFRQSVQQLAEADMKTSLFEYTLQRILLRRLDPLHFKTKLPVIQYYDLRPLLPQCGILLSVLAYAGSDSMKEAVHSFDKGIERLRPGAILTPSPLEKCSLLAIDEALNALAAASPMLKKRVLDASAECVAYDGRVTEDEAELLRAVADSLDCPIPPFLSQPAAA